MVIGKEYKGISRRPVEPYTETGLAAILHETHVHLLSQQWRREGEVVVGEGLLFAVVPAGVGDAVHGVVNGHCFYRISRSRVGGVDDVKTCQSARLAGLNTRPAKSIIRTN